MKKTFKCFLVILTLIIIAFNFSTITKAQSTEQDGLQVELTTDKQNYALNEDIKITVSVTNANDFTVKNVSIEALLPDNFELKNNNQTTSTNAIDIPAGENITLQVIAIVRGGTQGTTETTVKETEQITSSDITTVTPTTTFNSVETTTNNTITTQIETTTNTTDITVNNETTKKSGNVSNVKETTSKNNKTTKREKNSTANNKKGKSPLTGVDYTILTVIFILFFLSLSILLYCLIAHMHKTKKIISLVLCIVIVISSLVGFTSYKAYAEEKANEVNELKTISVSEKIKVDNKSYTIITKVNYQFDISLNGTLTGTLHASQRNCNVGERTNVTFYFEVYSGETDENTEIDFYMDNQLVGTLKDSGIDGDVTKGDNIYSATFSMFSDERKFVKCSVKYFNDRSQEKNTISFQFYKPRTNNEQKIIDDFYTDITKIKSKYIINKYEKDNDENLAMSKIKSCYDEIALYLENRNDIEKYGFTGFNIMVDFDFGITVGIPFQDLIKDDTNSVLSLRSVNFKKNAERTSLYKSKIATLQPCYTDLKTSVFDEAATTIVSKNDNYIFSTNLDDEQVTIETMKSLSKYGIVILDSHGGNWENYGYIISLSEKAIEEKNEKYKASGDLDKTIIDNGGYYVITEEFFEKYYSKSDFDNTVIYLGTCHGGDDNVEIKEILKEKGTKAVLSYKNTVVATYNHEMITTISERLSKGDAIQEAVKKAKQKHGDHDPYLSSDVYNKLDFGDKLWYNMGFIESSNPAELILTGNDLSFSLATNPSMEQITGQVLDANDNSPISNVKITCSELNIRCVTDTNGKFSFNISLPLEQHIFTFEHENYQQKNITVTSNKYSLLDEIILERKNGSVSGCVKEASDKTTPIKGVEVQVINSSDTIVDIVHTDENGNFTLSLPDGKYKLNIGGEANKYLYENYTTEITVESDVWTVLKDDILLNKINFGIAGNVFDNQTKEPLTNVEVKAYKDNNGTKKYITSATTDNNGKYSLDVENSGIYSLEFIKTGYTTSTQDNILTSGKVTYAENQYLESDGTSEDTTFAGGNGTEQNPYKVSTPEQLNAVRNDLTAHYIQINDIDMSDWGNWEPIGDGDLSFNGEYNGDRYSISNIKINLSIESNCDIGLFGYAKNSTIENVQIKNSEYNVHVKNLESTHFSNVGGITGNIENSTIENCCFEGKINNTVGNYVYSRVGGIVAAATNSSVMNCYSNSSIVAKASSMNTMIGGIVAWIDQTTINKCYVAGSVVGENSNGPCYVGGINASANSKSMWGIIISYGGSVKNSAILLNDMTADGTTNYTDDIGNFSSHSNNIVFKPNSNEAMQQSTYELLNWDFENIWDINKDKNNGLPYLVGAK